MKSFRLRASGFLAALVLIAIALLAGPTYQARAVVIEGPTSTPSGTPAVNVNCVAGCGTNSQGAIDVNIASPNPVNVTDVSRPAPSAVPTTPVTYPATLPNELSVGACIAVPTPSPSPGQIVVKQCDALGHEIVGIEPSTTFSLGGTSTVSATPSPAAAETALPVHGQIQVQTGANQFPVLVSCELAVPIYKTISSATDTLILASGAAGARIFVCGEQVTMDSGANVGYFEQAASTSACTTLTEVKAPITYIPQFGYTSQSPFAQWSLPVGDSLCFNTNGSGPIELTVTAVVM